jgi:formate dehydrogenase subunit gamma
MSTKQGQVPFQVPWNKEVALERIRGCLDRKGPLLPILHALQEEFGYVDEAAEPLIAEALNITRAEVHGVISFYHDFRTERPGRKIIRVCRAESCQAMGAVALATHIKERLGIDFGQTSTNGDFTLEPVYCLGNCACSPAIVVGDDLYGRVTPDRFDEILFSVSRSEPN